MVTPVENSLLKHLTNFIIFLTCLYGSRFSFMIVLNVKQINISLLNPEIFLLLYHFMKTPFFLITEYQWVLKAPFLLLTQNNSYIFDIIDAFSHLVVTNPAPHITSEYAIQTLLHHWITNFAPPQYLVTDRGTEYINQDKAFFTKPTNWSFQTQTYAYAHNITPLSQLKLSPYHIVFHTHPRIPLTFSLNIPRDSSNNCIATYCVSLPLHTHYSTQNLHLFSHSLLDKPISSWLLSAEHAM